MAGQQADSRYWPNDETLAASLTEEPLYKTLIRARLRMVLEALEDQLRGSFGEGQPCPQGLTIEHVMPQAWREHWGADLEGDEVGALRRDRLVHTLGNLTLVNAKLNPALSNRPWTDAESIVRELGGGGKRSYLLEHSQLSLNSHIVANHPNHWTEQDLRARGAELLHLLTAIWPCPPNAVQPVSAKEGVANQHDEGNGRPVGKYVALRDWLAFKEVDELRLTFAEVEDVLAVSLPPSARSHLAHWYSAGGSALTRAIRDAGWRAQAVSLTEERVTFRRLNTEATNDDEPLKSWGTTDEDADAARYMWQNLSPTARRLFETLMSVAPAKVSAPDLAQQHDILGATGVAGVLAWPARYAANAGRHPPIKWEPGNPSQYWMEGDVAQVFRAAQMGTD